MTNQKRGLKGETNEAEEGRKLKRKWNWFKLLEMGRRVFRQVAGVFEAPVRYESHDERKQRLSKEKAELYKGYFYLVR